MRDVAASSARPLLSITGTVCCDVSAAGDLKPAAIVIRTELGRSLLDRLVGGERACDAPQPRIPPVVVIVSKKRAVPVDPVAVLRARSDNTPVCDAALLRAISR